MALLDVAKALDSVWIDGLIYKLVVLKFSSHLIQLIYSCHTFRVRVNGVLGIPRSIVAELPQSSCLGSQLSTLYINDLPTHHKTNLTLFTDETTVVARSFSVASANKHTQQHIRILQSYWDK